ncbi:H/ACA ribonucleoprotein complex non-core subunit NAF1 [Habropoda laboriosa]|uniref:H/ACA ribonucleoprotein complex non-core subunit NAF1 n=2 Tax=Habropoda laboriosa TaxID=597456 RepID=A0A0L7R3K9_9HYME|nr:H/ACA ribonucleoprotein complex non-core subunit NAF1 [Habropoda laboriosa]
MDTNEVIIEKIIANGGTIDEFKEHTSKIEENNDVPSTIENFSLLCKENIQNNVDKVSQITDDCEVILSDENVETKENCNKKDNTNHLLFEKLKQKDDVHIVHEENVVSAVQKNDKMSSLVSIAVEYGNSDSETEDNSNQNECDNKQSKQLQGVHMQTYRQNIEASVSEESDSEDDFTSSSDSSIISQPNESDSDDSSNKRSKGNKLREQKNNEIKNELDDLPPIEDLKISVPEVLCDPLGEVAWMVEQLVVVKPKSGKPTLNLDTILFVEKGQRALGKIFDVFGQVSEPHYCVRFNSSEHIKQYDVKVGMTVYYCPNTEYTSLVFLHELMKIKGIDATADEPPEFSDDEEERAYYEKLKAKQANNINEMDIPSKRKRTSKPTTGWQSNHPWNRTTKKYRKGYYPRSDRQFCSMQTENQTQNIWSHPYQNNSEQYGPGAYSMQAVQYMNHNVNSVKPNFYGPHNYYNEDSMATSSNSRGSFNTCPRVSPGYLPFYNSPTNLRFQNANMSWQPHMPQVPVRMKIPWLPLPPPPPPPTTLSSDPPPSTSSSDPPPSTSSSGSPPPT